jgi:hypothetical protein
MGRMLLFHIHAEQSLEPSAIQSHDFPLVDEHDRRPELSRAENQVVSIGDVSGDFEGGKRNLPIGHEPGELVACVQAIGAALVVKERYALDHT